MGYSKTGMTLTLDIPVQYFDNDNNKVDILQKQDKKYDFKLLRLNDIQDCTQSLKIGKPIDGQNPSELSSINSNINYIRLTCNKFSLDLKSGSTFDYDLQFSLDTSIFTKLNKRVVKFIVNEQFDVSKISDVAFTNTPSVIGHTEGNWMKL